MSREDKPQALLLVSSQCPHCHALEALLRERMGEATLSKLEVVNVEQSPELARQYEVRSVPWLRLGDFVFNEALTPGELDRWIGLATLATKGAGQTQYIAYLLEHGGLMKAIAWLEQGHATLQALVPLLADPDAKMNVRVGAGAIVEHFENSDALRAVMPDLITLLADNNPAIRTDACHYLSLTHSQQAIEPLEKMLADEDGEVSQVARESLEVLQVSMSSD